MRQAYGIPTFSTAKSNNSHNHKTLYRALTSSLAGGRENGSTHHTTLRLSDDVLNTIRVIEKQRHNSLVMKFAATRRSDDRC